MLKIDERMSQDYDGRKYNAYDADIEEGRATFLDIRFAGVTISLAHFRNGMGNISIQGLETMNGGLTVFTNGLTETLTKKQTVFSTFKTFTMKLLNKV